MRREQRRLLELDVRKFRRRKLLQYHVFEQDLLQEDLRKRQQHLEVAHGLLLRHHESTQQLEERQLGALHALRDEHLQGQHESELQNQAAYNQKAERETRRKHALENKQQPKSLKVR